MFREEGDIYKARGCACLKIGIFPLNGPGFCPNDIYIAIF